MKVNQDILSIYEEILTNNKNILSELELVQLNDTSYSNLKYDNDGTQYDSVNKPLLDDLNTASKAAGITTTITTAKTGHPDNTVTGNKSRHGQQTAVDIAILNGVGSGGATNSSNGNAEFRSLGDKLKDALVSMGYTLNSESGNSKAVLWQTNTGGNHFNHLHVSNNSGESGTTPTSDQSASEKAYDSATGAETSKSTSIWNAPNVPKDDDLIKIGKSIAGGFLKKENTQMKEQKSFDKNILSIYEEILTNNKNILSELELVQLNDTSYSNLKYDNDGTQYDSVNKPLLDDLNTASKAAGITTTITTAKTGHPDNTVTGNKSRHGQQTAVDIAILNGVGSGGATNSSNGNAEFRSLGDKLKDALVSMGYTLNSESGNSKAVLWQTNTGGNHFNHLHVSNNSGESGTTPTSDQSASEKAYDSATGAETSKSTSIWNAPNVPKDDDLIKIGKSIAGGFLKKESIQMNEQKSFGRDISNRYGRIIIPKDTNPKIKSPISGVVYNKRYSSSCTNQITIKNEDGKKFYLQFCGISNPSVRDGQSISIGDVIGKTDSDVEVTMFDSSWSTMPIGSDGVKTDSPKKNEPSSKDGKKKETDKYYSDPLLAMAASLPAKAIEKVFGNRYDEKTGEMTQKRWGGVADEREVDPWILNFIKDPLGRKKVTEDVEKIKRLLK